MNSFDLLQKKKFWYSFIALVVLTLLIYGLSIENGKTELQKTKIELADKIRYIKECNEEIRLKDSKISKLNISISTLNQSLSEKDKLISDKDSYIAQLEEEIQGLKNRPPEVITKYQDKIVYKDKPEPYHQYGKGYGQLVVYTTCSNGGRLTVWIDGESVGYLDKYQTGTINCNISGVIRRNVINGKHHITGRDQNNKTWDGYITVYEDECQTYGLTCK